MRWSMETRKRAAKLFEEGYGYKAVSTQLGMNRETARDWSYTWRALGSDALCRLEEPRVYTPETKMAVVRDRERGVPVIDVMQRYGVLNRSRIKDWCSLYRKKGMRAFL